MTTSRKNAFLRWFTRYLPEDPSRLQKYRQALENPDYVIRYRRDNPSQGHVQAQDLDLSCFPASRDGIFSFRTVEKVKAVFDETRNFRVGDDGAMHTAIGYYAMWLRLMVPNEWSHEPFWEKDFSANGEPVRKTRAGTLLEYGLDYRHAYETRKITYKMDKYLAAIRTKSFILLAGISGTGKSRLVRQLARGFCPAEGPLADEKKPGNFEMIQVRPNWHDSTELLGYVSRVSGTPTFVVKDFVKFLVKAWMYPKTPFFLCLDEMNLAPVEQYFAEYLSVIETRQKDGDAIVTDPILTFEDAVYNAAKEELLKPYADEVFRTARETLEKSLDADRGLRIPPNLVVMGTVNMDETTCSFSRKVLDRAMSFELNEVNMRDGLEQSTKVALGAFGHDGSPLQAYIEADEVYPPNKELCDKVLKFLEAVNAVLDKTPFKIAYRSRNEIMVYCVERTKGELVPLAQALDEATSMKILSRIEGDRRRLRVDNSRTVLDVLKETIDAQLKALNGDAEPPTQICRDKLEEMKAQLEGGYASFWTR